MSIQSVSAITLGTHDMARAYAFYAALDFELIYGGPGEAFVSFRAGSGYLNLTAQAQTTQWTWWGRVIFYVDDVDAQYQLALAAGYETDTVPRDAPWKERYFHITDPDGHELSFAKPLADH
jgi:catechol 2,3-dioxygenase-like lactoylglutathione lyase family enzyme